MRRGIPIALLAGGAAYVGGSWLLSRSMADRLISSKGLAPCRQPREDLIATLRDAGADVRDFRFFGASRSPVELAAVFASDGAAGTRATIVFLHGKGGGCGEWTPDAVRALDQGFNVLMPDLRGHAPSGGAFVTFGLLEREDLARAVDAAASRFGLDPGRLGVHACSAGGTIALAWAAREPAIRAIWLESPFADAREMARHYLAVVTGIPRFLLGLTTDLAVRRVVRTVRRALSLPPGRNLEGIDPIAALASIRVPVYLVHGRRDRLVPPRFAERLEGALPPGSSVWAPPAGHCHHDDQPASVDPEGYARRWTGFFGAALASRVGP